MKSSNTVTVYIIDAFNPGLCPMDNIGRSQVLSTSEWVIPGCPASYDCKENLDNLVLFNVIYKSNRELHTGTCMGTRT